MIATERVHSIKRLPEEQRKEYGALVLVMRQWPRGLSRNDVDYWVQDAAPSQELLDAYRDGLASWTEFEWWYETEQACREQCRVVCYMYGERLYDKVVSVSPMQILRAMQEKGKITLLCWEDSEFCHRHTLKSLLDEHNHAESEI